MKTTTFLAGLAFVLLLSCQKTTRYSKDEKELNLIAPSGQAIANSISQFKARAASLVTRKFGTQKDFTITGISYLPVKEGYAALVTLRLSDGQETSYAILSGNNIKALPPVLLNVVSQSRESMSASIQYTITCEANCTCRAYASYNRSTNELRVFCSGCDQCVATVTVEN